MLYLKKCAVFLTLFLVFISGCDSDNSRKTENPLSIDEDVVLDADIYVDEDTIDDSDVYVDEDVDAEPSLFPDDSFLTPSKGLTIKMKGIITSQSEQTGETEVLDAVYTDENGDTFYLNDKTSAALYAQSGEVFLTISEATITDNKYHFLYFSFPKLYLESDGIGKISERSDIDPTVYQYEYKEGGKIIVQCPVAVKDSDEAVSVFVDSENQTFLAEDIMYIMMNVPLIKGKTALRELYGESTYDSMCYCYDYVEEDGGYNPRSCEMADLYSKPEKPYAVSPEDRELKTLSGNSVNLSFSGGEDPQGFDVIYTVFAGTDPLNLATVAENITTKEVALSAESNNNYFWKIKAENSKGLSSESEIYSFSTKDSSNLVDLLILSNADKETALSEPVNDYIAQLQNEGYKAEVKYLSFDETTPLTVDELKDIIKNYYQEHFIRGVLLLGEFPAAWYEMDLTINSSTNDPYVMYESFPTDIYLSDLSAEWFDERDEENNAVSNDIYDRHTSLNANLFISRILGESDEITAYFTKVKKYKTEGNLLSPSLFLFIDEDWQTGAGSTWWLEDSYETITEYSTTETTTQTDYLDFMTESGAEFIYQWIHSDPQTLYFDTNYGGEFLTLKTIKNSSLKGSFYNLFDCSAVKFTEKNLGDTYLKTDYGLAVVGSAKTGGMYNPKIFHTDLVNQIPWGIAFRDWYNEEGTKDDTWFLGFTIMGDPLITIKAENSSVYKKLTTPKEFNVLELQNMKRKMLESQKSIKKETFDSYKKSHPAFFNKMP